MQDGVEDWSTVQTMLIGLSLLFLAEDFLGDIQAMPTLGS